LEFGEGFVSMHLKVSPGQTNFGAYVIEVIAYNIYRRAFSIQFRNQQKVFWRAGLVLIGHRTD
jgi:hypothetical protein